MKKIIILTGSYGQGHNAATNSLKNCATKLGANIKVYDIADFFYQLPGKLTKSFYEDFCQEYPSVWKVTFDIFDDKRIARIIYGLNAPVLQEKVNKVFNEEKLDLVICVFPFWLGFIKHYIKSYGKNFNTGVVITDAISLHSVWYLRGDYIDKYFVIDEQTKLEFKNKFDHNSDNVIVSYFPIEKKYFMNKESINNKNICILLSSLSENFVNGLLKKFIDEDFNIMIVKGRNNSLFSKLKLKYSNISNFEFIEFIDFQKSFSKIDIMIAKSGGALMCECIATDTPIIIPSYVQGQEEGNVKLVEMSGVGIYEKNPDKAFFMVKYLNRSLLKPNFAKLKKPDSCKIIFDNLISK